MKKTIIFLSLMLLCSPAFAGKEYARRYPTDTSMEVYTPNNPPPSETDPLSLHLDQTTPQSFSAGAVSGSGLLNVTSGELGLDTNTYLTASDLTPYALLDGTNQPFTGDLNISKATPELKLTGTSEYSRITRADTSNILTFKNRSQAPGPSSYGINFDGSTEKVVLSNTSLGLTNAITISFWFKGTDTSGHLFSISNGSTLLRFLSSGGNIAWQVVPSGGWVIVYSDSSSLNNNQWHHCVGVYNGTTVILYVDGVKKVHTLTTSGSIPSGYTWLGGSYNGTPDWAGLLDEIAVWSRVLTDDEIAELHNSGSGNYASTSKSFSSTGTSMSTNLRAIWHLDGDLLDSSGNGYNGTGYNIAAGDYEAGKVSAEPVEGEYTFLQHQDSDDATYTEYGEWGTSGGKYTINSKYLSFENAGTEQFYIDSSGDLVFPDNQKTYLGTGKDASLTYDGTNLLINPREVGTGSVGIKGATQDALLSVDSFNHLLDVQSSLSGQSGGIQAFTKDGDGTDYISFLVYGYGLPGNFTNRHRMIIGQWNPASGYYRINTDAAGTQSAKALSISTSATTDQLFLATGGAVLMGGVTTASQSETFYPLQIEKSQNAATGAWIRNTNTGTSGVASLTTQTDTGIAYLLSHGSGRTITRYGITVAGYSELLGGGNGLLLGEGTTNKPIIIGTNDKPKMVISDANGVMIVGNPSNELRINAQTLNPDITFEENSGLLSGTNYRAQIYYDITNNRFSFRAADSGTLSADNLQMSGTTSDVMLPNDSAKLLFGTGYDASITYNGTNLLINPQEVGTGSAIVNYDTNAAGVLQVYNPNVGTSTQAQFVAKTTGAQSVLTSHGSTRVTTRYGTALGGFSELIAMDASAGSCNGLMIGTYTLNKPIIFGTQDVERMRITGAGDILIGTTSVPAAAATGNDLLIIEKDQDGRTGIHIQNDQTSQSAIAAIRFQTDVNTAAVIGHSSGRTVASRYGTALGGFAEFVETNASANGMMIGLSSADKPIIFGNNNTERFRIDAGGDLKIKADSKKLSFGAGDDALLQFTGTQFQVQSDNTTATDSLLLRGGTNGIYFNIGASEYMQLTASALTIGTPASFTKTQDAPTVVSVNNTSSGSSAESIFQVTAENAILTLGAYNSSYGTSRYGVSLADAVEIVPYGSPSALVIGTGSYDVPIVFGSNATEVFRVTSGGAFVKVIKSGATQAGAGAAAGELWKTASHATLPDNVVMIGV
jgi:hypothetical protein